MASAVTSRAYCALLRVESYCSVSVSPGITSSAMLPRRSRCTASAESSTVTTRPGVPASRAASSDQPLEHLDGGRLAGAVRAQQAETLAGLDGEIEAGDGD